MSLPSNQFTHTSFKFVVAPGAVAILTEIDVNIENHSKNSDLLTEETASLSHPLLLEESQRKTLTGVKNPNRVNECELAKYPGSALLRLLEAQRRPRLWTSRLCLALAR